MKKMSLILKGKWCNEELSVQDVLKNAEPGFYVHNKEYILGPFKLYISAKRCKNTFPKLKGEIVKITEIKGESK